MNNYVILTDSGCDLPGDLARELGLEIVSITHQLRGETHNGAWMSEADIKDFYAALRAGEMAVTAQANPDAFDQALRPLLEQGKSVIAITLSGAISGTVNSARLAAEDLNGQYGQAKVAVIDSLCASLGQGMLVWLVAQEKARGASFDEAVAYAEDAKLRINHIFTVDDLGFLKRGGRVSGASALLGSLLHIKPVMYVDNQGRLLVRDKVPMRKRAIRELAQAMANRGIDADSQTVFISHGDASEEADMVIAACRETFPNIKVVKWYVGPSIGAHSGPGTLALFFLGRNRDDAK